MGNIVHTVECTDRAFVAAMDQHGRHFRPFVSTTVSKGPEGPNPKAGTVAPKTATTGVPTAVARCKGALSLHTRILQRRSSSADWSKESIPDASYPRRPAEGSNVTTQLFVFRSSDENCFQPSLIEIHRQRSKPFFVPSFGIPDRSRSNRYKILRVTHLELNQQAINLLSVCFRWIEPGRFPTIRSRSESGKQREIAVDLMKVLFDMERFQSGAIVRRSGQNQS